MRRPPLWLVATAVLAIPFAVLAVRAVVGIDLTPGGDVALIQIRTGDVGTAHHPTLGSYGRFGFNHPGPLWFYVLALPYRITSQLELGVILVAVLSIAAILWVAARRDGLWWTALLTAVLIAGAGPAVVSDPWEPHGLVLPCAALLFLTYDTAAGRQWSLPLVAGVASLLGAAQATLLPFAVAMGAVALWGARRHLRPVLASVAVLLVLWSPTIWQQWTGNPTNITQLRDSRDREGSTLGFADAWQVVSTDLGHTPPWIGFDPPRLPYSGLRDTDAAPIVPIGVVALAWALVRRRTPLVIVAVVAAASALIAMSQLLGEVFVWIPQWLRVVGFGCWLAIGWQVASRIPRPALVSGVAAVTLLTTWRAATFEDEPDHLSAAVRRLVAELPPLEEPILASSTVSANQIFTGRFDGLEVLVLELEGRGVEAVVDPRLANRFGPRRAENERAKNREVILVHADSKDKPGGFTSVGLIDPLPPALREERDRLLDELGLRERATARQTLLAIRGDEDRQRKAERVLAIPNLPRVELLLSPDH